MNDFALWFSTGMEHILSLGAYDHLLFIGIIVFSQPPEHWRRMVLLVTAFTLGHAVSAFLTAVHLPSLPADLIEFLIAFSILVAAAAQIRSNRTKQEQSLKGLFGLVFFFGLFHGLGFSMALRSMLGHTEQVFLPLLYFNFGIETAQIIIVAVLLLFSLFLAGVFRIKHHTYHTIFLWLILLPAGVLTLQRLFQLLA